MTGSVGTGPRQENASKQKIRAPFRFHRNGKALVDRLLDGMTPSRLGSDRLGAEPRAHRIIGRYLSAALVGVSRRQARAEVRTWNGSRIVTGTLCKSLCRGAEQQHNEDGR